MGIHSLCTRALARWVLAGLALVAVPAIAAERAIEKEVVVPAPLLMCGLLGRRARVSAASLRPTP